MSAVETILKKVDQWTYLNGITHFLTDYIKYTPRFVGRDEDDGDEYPCVMLFFEQIDL